MELNLDDNDSVIQKVGFLFDIARRHAWLNRMYMAELFLSTINEYTNENDIKVIFHQLHSGIERIDGEFRCFNGANKAVGQVGYIAGEHISHLFEIGPDVLSEGYYPHRDNPKKDEGLFCPIKGRNISGLEYMLNEKFIKNHKVIRRIYGYKVTGIYREKEFI